jgi:hypothetical protein
MPDLAFLCLRANQETLATSAVSPNQETRFLPVL